MTPSQDQILQRLLAESGEEFEKNHRYIFTKPATDEITRSVDYLEVRDFLTAAITKAFHAGADAQRERDAKISDYKPPRGIGPQYEGAYQEGYQDGRKDAAAAIRSQPTQKPLQTAATSYSENPNTSQLSGNSGELEHCPRCRSGFTQSPLKDLCEKCSCHAPEQPTQKPLQDSEKGI